MADLEARLAVVEAVRPSGVGAGNGADDADHAADDPEIEARFKAEATGVFEGENAPPEALPPAPAEDPEQEDSKDPDKAKAYNVNVGADFDPAVAEPAEDGPK